MAPAGVVAYTLMRLGRLDSIRAFAIVIVIASHHFLFTELGWAGVDLFFVLSGLLITRILRASSRRATYWSRFYLKRAVRILPPLALLFLLGFVLSRHIALLTFAGYALFLGNVMNLTRYRNGLFLVLWSLAVEEHFYLLWPLAVKLLSRRRLIALLAAVLVLGPVLRSLATPHVSTFEPIFLLTPFRLDSIAAGSLLTLLTESDATQRWLALWSLPSATAAIAVFGLLRWSVPTFLRDANSLIFNSVGYSLIAVIGFFLVAWILLLSPGRANSTLSWRPFVYIGRISYGMYLFHNIVLTVLKKLLHIPFGTAGIARTQHLFPLELALTILLAAISFHFFETPLLNWGDRRAKALERWRGDPLESEQAEASGTVSRMSS